MAKLEIKAGSTSQSVNVFIQDSSSTTGAGLTGLVFNTSSLVAYYTFVGANVTATAITLATLAAVNSAYSSGGFKEIDSADMPGLYRLDIPNAAIASASGRASTIMLKGATNMAPCVLEIELTGWDNQDAVHGGFTCLPNTAVTTNASLLTSGSGTDQLTVTGGLASADAKKVNAVSTSSVTTINANIGVTQPINFTGTAGSALVKSDMVDIAGAAVSTSSAQIGVNAVNIAGVAASLDANNFLKVDIEDIKGTASIGTAGYMGPDWGHVNAPTTTVGLTGTTIATSQVVASVTGNVGGSVASLTTNNDKTGYAIGVGGIAASAFAAGAIDAAAIAANAITSSEFAQSAADLVWGTAARTLTEVFTIKKNTALANFSFIMVDAADHIAPKTGLTVAVAISIDGGAFAGATNTPATEIGNGWYKINLAAADLNGNTIGIKCTAAGADQQNIIIITQPNT